MSRIGLFKKFNLVKSKLTGKKSSAGSGNPVDDGNPPPKEELLAQKKKHVKALAEGSFYPNAHEAIWAQAVMDLFELDADQDNFATDVAIALTPRDYKKYHVLQTKIASLGEDKAKEKEGLAENKRPTINLTVKGNNAPATSFGILGGTGPLSDAEMLVKTMESLEHDGFDLEKVHIRLLSAPPPRLDDKGLAGVKKKVVYVNRATKFSGEDHSKMALASNTAHLNLKNARLGKKLGRVRKVNVKGLEEDHQVQDLAGRVVTHVCSAENSRPLILGTKEAYDKKLYPNKFAAENVTAAEVQPGAAVDLQKWIDQAKIGGYDQERARVVIDFILQEVARQNPRPTHIILGCTELPLALGHDGMAELEKKLTGIEFVDTEEFFAQEYAKMVKANANDTTPAKAKPAHSDHADTNEEQEDQREHEMFPEDDEEKEKEMAILEGRQSEISRMLRERVQRSNTEMIDQNAPKIVVDEAEVEQVAKMIASFLLTGEDARLNDLILRNSLGLNEDNVAVIVEAILSA